MAKPDAEETFRRMIVRGPEDPEPSIPDEVFHTLLKHPRVIRALYVTFVDPRPCCGWAPMLCEIVRRVTKALKDQGKV